MEVIVGTAGHIDHGKTALIKALTGIDADRLPEEKRRGITVDLGFAEMSVEDVHFGFVDVPGHERFVKNMLAGASGIDIVMLVIAADEGVMPQTREHFDICRLLAVSAGIVVITKTDLVDVDTLEIAKLDATELIANSFLENAAVIGVSSRTDDGIDLLKEALVQIANNLPKRNDQLVTRLPIDRSFSVKGFGAVVTGTLASGKLTEGDEVDLLPSRTKLRVRGLQTHGKVVKAATAGQRVAVNLGGIDYSRVIRGMEVAEPNVLLATQVFDAAIEVLPGVAKPLRSRQRVRVHIGTVEALARIQILNETGEIAVGNIDLAQIRLEMAVTAVPGERFIIRSYSPQITIAGGEVIDTFAPKHRRRDMGDVRLHLNGLLAASGDNATKVMLLIEAAGPSGLSFGELHSRTGFRKELVLEAVGSNIASGTVVDSEGRYLACGVFERLEASAVAAVKRFHQHEPLAKGMSREALREKLFAHVPDEIFQGVVARLDTSGAIRLDRDSIRLSSYETELSPTESALRERILGAYTAAKLEVQKLDEVLETSVAGTKFTRQDARKFFQLFLDSGEIVKVTDEFYFLKSEIDRLGEKLKQFAATTNDRAIDMTQFKDLAGVSRKYAIPLIEYFDRERVSVRRGDKRIIL